MTGKPLLEVMTDPGKGHFSFADTGLLIIHPDRVFFQGLKLFPHIRIYANA